MGLLDINLENAEELKVLADNTEAEVRVTRAEVAENYSDNNLSDLVLTFDVPDEPLVDDIRVWLNIPNDALKEVDVKRHVRAVTRMKQFCAAFDVSFPTETEDLVGKTGWAIISERVDNTQTLRNGIRKFLGKS